jgi:hypothetical protein
VIDKSRSATPNENRVALREELSYVHPAALEETKIRPGFKLSAASCGESSIRNKAKFFLRAYPAAGRGALARWWIE